MLISNNDLISDGIQMQFRRRLRGSAIVTSTTAQPSLNNRERQTSTSTSQTSTSTMPTSATSTITTTTSTRRASRRHAPRTFGTGGPPLIVTGTTAPYVTPNAGKMK